MRVATCCQGRCWILSQSFCSLERLIIYYPEVRTLYVILFASPFTNHAFSPQRFYQSLLITQRKNEELICTLEDTGLQLERLESMSEDDPLNEVIANLRYPLGTFLSLSLPARITTSAIIGPSSKQTTCKIDNS